MKKPALSRNQLLLLVASAAMAFSFTSCSEAKRSAPETMPQVGAPTSNGAMVKSRAIIPVLVSSTGRVVGVAPSPTTSATLPITVTNAANTSMTIDSRGWVVPTIDNSVVDFGVLAIATLFDNNLNTCGASANQHCGAALIRTYTTGKPGAGIWNDVDHFGAPLMASLDGLPPMGTVGLDPAGAFVLQSVDIPQSKHVLKLSDFAPPPRYDYKADFTDAGAGTYATTLVIEYVLAPSRVLPSPTPSPTVTPTPSPSATPSPAPSPTVTPTPSPSIRVTR